jgi:Protein of unknown function (DUF2023)
MLCAPASGVCCRPPAVAGLGQALYEFRKGVRSLFMMTMTPLEAAAVAKRLRQEAVAHHLQAVSVTKTNVFFGREACVAVVRTLAIQPLYQLTPEQDFILGTLLGYDREQQCERYLARCASVALAPPCHEEVMVMQFK